MTKKMLIVLVVQQALLFTALGEEARATWAFEFMGGDAYCFNMPLTICQSGYEDIDLTARYDEISFETPIYYSIRAGRWYEGRAWEIELVHLKIDLINKPNEVERFEISHGYNLLTINRAWEYRKFILRAGAGVVVSHPETTVRGKTLPDDRGLFNGGYYISGPTAQVSLGKRFYLWREHVFAALEAKLTGSYARVPIEDGHANVPNVGIHGLLGVGCEL